jgi:cold shock CspA family protein
MRLQGRITYYVPNRKFGFIKTPDGREIFFHASNCVGVPALSSDVEFELGAPIKEGKPPQVVNVTPVDDLADLLSGSVQ